MQIPYSRSHRSAPVVIDILDKYLAWKLKINQQVYLICCESWVLWRKHLKCSTGDSCLLILLESISCSTFPCCTDGHSLPACLSKGKQIQTKEKTCTNWEMSVNLPGRTFYEIKYLVMSKGVKSGAAGRFDNFSLCTWRLFFEPEFSNLFRLSGDYIWNSCLFTNWTNTLWFLIVKWRKRFAMITSTTGMMIVEIGSLQTSIIFQTKHLLNSLAHTYTIFHKWKRWSLLTIFLGVDHSSNLS